MGAKLYADTATKTLVMTETPDVNGFVNLNAQEEVWSDLIIDWENDVSLRKFTFPVVAIGGDTVSAGKLGTTYVLLTPWQIEPWDDDHDFNIDGNLFTESALTKLVLPTAGPYTVTVSRNLSTLVEVVEAVAAAPITAALDKIVDGVYGQKLAQYSTNALLPLPGYMVFWEEDGVTLIGHKEIFETDDKSIGYRGKGIGWEGPMLPGMPP